MTKIEEILDGRSEITKIQNIEFEVVIYNNVVEAMKEYAEWYAKRYLQDAMENVKFIYGESDVEGYSHNGIVDLDYESILNSPLPEHD